MGLRRGGKNTQKNYTKKMLMTQYQDGVIAHLVPDILECEVKWALGRITTNKASGGDKIPAKLFKIQEVDAFICCIQYVSTFGKLSRGHKDQK